MEIGKAGSFWDRSWKAAAIGQTTVKEHLRRSDNDPVIRLLKDRGAVTVCDAGCGCGLFSLALACSGFLVSGFDISSEAVALAGALLSDRGYCAESFHTADILDTGWADGTFDAAVARDVVDHMPIKDGVFAVKELLRIVRPGGCVLLTLDETDDEYKNEPHDVSPDGDYLFSGGKWEGMVFHPYSPAEIDKLTRGLASETTPLPGGRTLVMLPRG